MRARDSIDRRVEHLEARQQDLAAAIDAKAAERTPTATSTSAPARTRRRATPTPRV